MRRLPLPLVGLLAIALVAGSCSGDDAGTADTTTTAPSTTLPTGTSVPEPGPRVATDVDVCNLLRDEELATVLDDAGPGEVTVTQPDAEPGEVPALLTGQCSWPTTADDAFTLYYLGPTTAPDGATHLQDVIDLDPEFARDGAVATKHIGCCDVGLLIDRDGKLRELAVVHGSALLYLVVNQDVDGRDTEATDLYAQLISDALNRAPR
jgi:hypothetical protein